MNKDKRIKGGIAVAAGIALLLGGSTYALWSDFTSITGGTIVAGDLGIKEGDSKWYDTSSVDRADSDEPLVCDDSLKGHDIKDISDWRITPGDRVTGVFTAKAWLKGDNLVAKLSASIKAADFGFDDAMDITVDAYYDDEVDGWTSLSDADALDKAFEDAVKSPGSDGNANITLGYFQAPNQEAGLLEDALPILDDEMPVSDNVCVVLSAQWDKGSIQQKAGTTGEGYKGADIEIEDRDAVNDEVLVLPNIGVNLEQTRDKAEIEDWAGLGASQFK